MININNKRWEKLRVYDIEKLLSGADDENFFFEFKSDEETPAKLVREISAFANTYGGYVLLGINDDKTFGGCTKWTEQRIHTTIHDSLTPVPNFDVRKFKKDGKVILVIKIEEGIAPPYITNKGQIFERVSSGSFVIKESSRIVQLHQKREEQLLKIKNKIENIPIKNDDRVPDNLFAHVDFGFSVVCSERTNLQKNFYNLDLKPIADFIQTKVRDFTISQVGHSYFFTFGEMIARNYKGDIRPIGAGIHNFIEIMADGSARGRIILRGVADEETVDISVIGYLIREVFREIYLMLLGDDFSKIFISAHKYEQLTVIKQFVPFFALGSEDSEDDKQAYKEYLKRHKKKYGNNLVVTNSRVPYNDYILIDKRYLSNYKVKYNTKNLLSELFMSYYSVLGYIDEFEPAMD